MKKKLIILLLLLWQYIPAQVFPDYKERSHPFITDTTFFEQQFTMGATEGIIDPEEYILAPGDKLFISVRGIEENSINSVINHEGFIFLPKVGGIDLRNTSLAEGKKKILDQISRYYKNVDVFIALSDFRRIKVSLIGDVKKPSSYIIQGNSRLIDLIMISEGFNPTSDLRNIRIINKQKVENKYDLLSFLRLGDFNTNPLLREGDVVIVDKVDRTVSISGQIAYPGSYELVEGETAGNLIRLAGGLTSKAKTDSIEIVSFLDDGLSQNSKYYSYEQLDSKDLSLRDKDHVMIRGIPEFLEEKYVLVDGYVKYPGYYKIIEGETKLTDILNEAGGFRRSASLNEATLIRESGTELLDPEFERLKLIPRAEMTDDEYDYLKAKSRQRKGNVVVDFTGLFDNNIIAEDLFLKRGDKIYIPEKRDYITLIGQVITPGNIIYQKGMNYEHYIELAGGFGWRALDGDVRIIKAKTGEWLDAGDDVFLEPGDIIWIPENPPPPRFWDVFITSLSVLGQVAAVIAAVAAVIAISR
jgi:polysaccharide biosynthesis/export protein